MGIPSLAAEFERAQLLKQVELARVAQRFHEAFKSWSALSTHGLGSLALEGTLRQARASLSTIPFMDARSLAEATSTAKWIKVIVRQQQQGAFALSSALAESSRVWQDVIKWQTEASRLVDLRYVESLKAIQSEMQGIAQLACRFDLPANSIAHAALKNVQVFHRVNADRLKDALEGVRLASAITDLPIAARYVLQYNDFVHVAAPSGDSLVVRTSRRAERFTHGEEIGPRLETELEKLDPRLAELRCQAWENIGKKSAPALRLAAHAIRELFSEVVRRLAPDEVIINSALWQNREDSQLRRPTRQMRFKFLLCSDPEKLAAVSQFAGSLDKAHKYAHTFPEDPELVRAYLAEVETCVYLLLVYTRGSV
jgi:hypothetical protein